MDYENYDCYILIRMCTDLCEFWTKITKYHVLYDLQVHEVLGQNMRQPHHSNRASGVRDQLHMDRQTDSLTHRGAIT